ncbi:hypothetical protein CUZ56_01786 [Saezia sanguinis]|uniref:EF-hand domain-containing protein n=1 Tax=Saezia sanguinis TaxID=1965230 RepID=A0A433SCU8_9BURK|nr:hypothetical protein [Saezia sanguinis]RUS66506.1 hypothetical protein CUZ56_01786 [Saezia sanguinis]
MNTPNTPYPWTFQRIGGLDQVVLASADDISHLDQLDPKLWVALSCPTSGMEFDTRTLQLLDSDKDERIRIPEVVQAVKWLCQRLNDPGEIIHDPQELPLASIKADTDEGQRLLATAHAILNNLGKPDAQTLTQQDVARSAAHAGENVFNGDGILPPLPALQADICDFIQNALDIIGGVEDAGGQIGINSDIANAFTQSLQNWQQWRKTLDGATTPLGANTPEAWDLLSELSDKINDYFLRTELAGYAPQAQAVLNVDEKFLVPVQNGLLESEALSELPLSKIQPQQPLDLHSGINPVWRDRVQRFAELIAPLLAQPASLTFDEWRNIQKTLAPYSQAVALKPALVSAKVTTPPTSTIDKLGADKINELLSSGVAERFIELTEKDSTTPAAAADIADVERLVLYYKHLYHLLRNYTNFHDFYDMDCTAAFQAGILFIDGRSCRLCVPVADAAKHATLAAYTELYLLYCECTRTTQTADGEKQEKRLIAAAMTAGNSDLLLESRNGVFIDNQGNDWDATVIKIIAKPISLKEAIWSPYKRFGRMVSTQINKWASSKDDAIAANGTQKLQTLATSTPAAATTGTAATTAAPKFDIAKNVGIFAAIGLALGAIGTALATLARALFSLQWWQFPLVFLGIFLLISGPSVIIAWFKLRQRTLGPLLEASGWAVNGRVSINYFLGSQLTRKAELPDNATRSYSDPTKPSRNKPLTAFIVALIIGAAAMGGWLWYRAAAKTPATPTPPAAEAVQNAPAAPATNAAPNTVPEATPAPPGTEPALPAAATE